MEKSNEKKICFIICTNDEQQLNECMMYLNCLEVPDGYEMDVLTVTDAKSMTSGYNEGMQASDAKYKIYIHQDTFIVEKNFLKKILNIFKKDEKVGMIGIVGAEKLSKDGVMWHEQRCGNFYHLDELIAQGFDNIEINKKDREVEVVDGFLMATQTDILWREDLFDGWDFYDVSQCMEFRKAGYKIVVPAQKNNWVIHACGCPSFWNYNKYREIFLKEYSDYINKEYLRILFVHSNMITLMGIPTSFSDLGHEVDIAKFNVRLNEHRDDDIEKMEEALEEGNYDLVSTYDFCPSVSDACEKMKVKYFAWVYDSPLLELYTKYAKNSYNYISVFDRKQYERLQELNIPHLYYLPLAAEAEVFGSVVVRKKDEKKYKADVAFVGRLYTKRGFEELFKEKDNKYLLEAENVIDSVKCKWQDNVSIYDKVSEGLIQYVSKKEPAETWKQYNISKRYYFESMRLARKCNELERVAILSRLSKKHNVVLYTDNQQADELPKVRIKPWVDYWMEMPKVFYVSKINLNITSRSIESGIPQRVLDIMAVGGFCLTNYQPELEEYFEIGKDLEVYHNLSELEEKVQYYLNHEEQRIRIAINGYKKVRNEHSLNKRLQVALDYIFSDNNI